MNSSLSVVLSDHHKVCDEEWASVEQCVSEKRWPEAATVMKKFCDAMTLHLSIEESTVFPAFEMATGVTQGPTRVMLHEHNQMRALLDDLNAALLKKDTDAFLGAGETLLVLMQQHNFKEENMLYPACDDALAQDAALVKDVVTKLEARHE